MDTASFYEIRVAGHLTERWSDWLAGLTIRNEPDGVTVLAGPVTDQAALIGVLGKLHALNLTILTVNRRPAA